MKLSQSSKIIIAGLLLALAVVSSTSSASAQVAEAAKQQHENRLFGVQLSPLEGKAGAQIRAALGPERNQFLGFIRLPVEGSRLFVPMDVSEASLIPNAYYRDAYMGAQIVTYGAEDGDTWTAILKFPDGTTGSWAPITFYSQYNGQENCFVGGGPTSCGYTDYILAWYTFAQCQPTGTYTIEFLFNGVKFDERQFNLWPQIKDGLVPKLYQVDYKDPNLYQYANAYDYNYDPPVPISIAVKGCALTALAMVLSYHGVRLPNGSPITPDELNTLFKSSGVYTKRNDVNWLKIAPFTGGRVRFAAAINFRNLNTNICTFGPQLVTAWSHGEPTGHFLTATGRDRTTQKFLINDPVRDTSPLYGESWTPSNSTRGFVGPAVPVTDPYTGVLIHLHSPAELLLTDPQGRRVGLDPSTGQRYDEIASAYYEAINISDPATGQFRTETKELALQGLVAGEYDLEVIGTGNGTYDLDFNTMDQQMNSGLIEVIDVPVTVGVRHHYRFEFLGQPGVPFALRAGFHGGGQSSKVNSLLTYAAPLESQTHLAAGTGTYAVNVFYGQNILPQTFRAVLEGVDVTSMFHPAAGTNERVTIPLVSGRNLLHLTVDGNVGTRVASDSDRLVFVIP